MDTYSKIKFTLFKIKWQALVYLSTGAFALLMGKELEYVAFFFCYVKLRYLFPKTFHHSNFYSCLYWSIFMLMTAITIMLHFSISLLFVILLAFVTGFILYYVEEFIEGKIENKTLKEQVDPEKELRHLCKELNMSHLLTEVCIDYKIHGLTRQEQADKMGYPINTIRKYRTEINKILTENRK